MFEIQNVPLFLISCILLNITPGQDTIYIIGRSVAQGKKGGIVSALQLLDQIAQQSYAEPRSPRVAVIGRFFGVGRAGDVDMGPAGIAGKFLQEQGRGDGPAVAGGGQIADVGHIAFEQFGVVIRHRHAPAALLGDVSRCADGPGQVVVR